MQLIKVTRGQRDLQYQEQSLRLWTRNQNNRAERSHALRLQCSISPSFGRRDLDYYTHADDDKSPSITKPSVASVSPGGKLLKLASALRLILGRKKMIPLTVFHFADV
jgi:hypothetical protein